MLECRISLERSCSTNLEIHVCNEIEEYDKIEDIY